MTVVTLYTCEMTDIVLTTINARYVHASLGLRYLAAQMGDLRASTHIVEFVLGQRAAEIAEQLLAMSPRLIGIGVYIWNVEESTRVVAHLLRPLRFLFYLSPATWFERRQGESDLRDARAKFEQALAIEPNFAKAAYHLGQVNQLLGDYDASVKAFRRALSIERVRRRWSRARGIGAAAGSLPSLIAAAWPLLPPVDAPLAG